MNKSKKLTTSDKINLAGITITATGLLFAFFKNVSKGEEVKPQQAESIATLEPTKPSPITTQPQLKYGYANLKATLYASISDSFTGAPVKGRELLTLSDKKFIGVFTGNKKGLFYEFASKLNGQENRYWVHQKEVQFSETFHRSRLKNSMDIKAILQSV